MKRYDSMGFEDELGGWVRWVDSDAALAQLRAQVADLQRKLDQAEATRSGEAFEGALWDEVQKGKVASVTAERDRLREALVKYDEALEQAIIDIRSDRYEGDTISDILATMLEVRALALPTEEQTENRR